MYNTRLRTLVACLTLVLCAATTADAQWGNLKGKFVYDGKAPAPQKLNVAKEPMCTEHNPVDESLLVGPDGGLKNVVIFVHQGREGQSRIGKAARQGRARQQGLPFRAAHSADADLADAGGEEFGPLLAQ